MTAWLRFGLSPPRVAGAAKSGLFYDSPSCYRSQCCLVFSVFRAAECKLPYLPLHRREEQYSQAARLVERLARLLGGDEFITLERLRGCNVDRVHSRQGNRAGFLERRGHQMLICLAP